VDHKRLGILYIVYALLFLVVGGVEVLVIRIHLALTQQLCVPTSLQPHVHYARYDHDLLCGHAHLVRIANYLVPLMIGARDMAFPRLNASSFWLSALGGILLYFSLLGGSGLYGAGNAPDVGWWAYAPLGGRAFSPGHSSDYWTLALLVSGVWKHWNGHQHYRHRSLHAMPWHEAQPHAPSSVAQTL
jgi:cytochrome c oxidase subunit I